VVMTGRENGDTMCPQEVKEGDARKGENWR